MAILKILFTYVKELNILTYKIPSYLTITLATSFFYNLLKMSRFWRTLYMLRLSSLACLFYCIRSSY